MDEFICSYFVPVGNQKNMISFLVQQYNYFISMRYGPTYFCGIRIINAIIAI